MSASGMMEPAPPSPEQLAAWAEAEREAERELAAADAAAAAAAAKAAPAAAAATHAPPRARRLLTIAVAVALTGGGSVGSALVFWKKPKPAADDHAAHPEPAHEPVAVSRIDDFIRAGSYADALALCRRALEELPPARHRALAYREALCLEGLGRLKGASEAFKRAEPAAGERGAWAVAVLGQARCAVASGDLAAAQQHLDRVTLRAGHPECLGTHAAEECQVLRVRLDALRSGSVRAMDPFAPAGVAWPPLTAPAEKYLDWLPPAVASAASGGPVAPNAARVHPVAGRPGEFEVTAHLAERRVADAVRALAAAAGLKPVVGAAATVALTKEVAAVDVEAAPLGDVLDALLAGHGLGWTIEGDRLTVTAGAAAADRGAAVRAFRRAVEAVPKHPSALAARVWLANFDFEAGRWTEAAAAYQEVLERAREEPEVPYAVYNLGLVELNAGAFQTARSRFVDLVDRAPRSRWADYGWWWVARTHFDAGDLAAAKRSFESALRGRAREVASAAALAVCVLELLDGTEDRARAALDGERGDMRPQHAALREALEAVLRYRQTPTPARRTALIAALGRSGDGAALGPGGAYFAGRVYRDLGVTERAVALFDDASARTRGPLAHRMAFEVAEWYDAREQADPARQRYLALAVTDPKGYGPKAELRLAQLALREQNLDDCLRRCRTLLTRAGADRTATLATMGRAYELRRNYRAAAECFAGRAPEE